MSDQFNISSISGFSISQIEPSDLPTVLDCMNEIYRELPEKSWFSMDEREDLIRYMTVSGFGLKAEAVAADGRKELAAVLWHGLPISVMKIWEVIWNRMIHSFLWWHIWRLPWCAVPIVAMDCKETNGSRRRAASFCRFRWLMGTAHPDNVYSVHNFEQLGYKLVTKALKYGGLRGIFSVRKSDYF